jgi:hypothetical protein
MRFLFLLEGIFFSCIYSTAPFFSFDTLLKPLLQYHFHEPVERKDMRYIFICSVAFIFYYFYNLFGFRTRYVLWHLERNRRASGFTPLETIAVATYHTVVLCLLTETALPVLDGKEPSLLSFFWLQNLSFRMKYIFLLSILEHSLLELSGYWDKIRRDYFEADRT